jgi:DNA-binding IclR family transcriptional regulator
VGTVSKMALDASSGRAEPATGAPKALVKGLVLVEAVADAGRPLRVVELVSASGMSRSTALRILEALLEREVLQQDSAGAYGLGPQLAVWGQQYLDGLDVRRQAEDLMRGLSDETRETCYLGVRDQRRVLYVAKADGSQAVRLAAHVGSRNPLHSTAIGKALLAFMPGAVVQEYLQGPLERRTPNTITEPGRLAGELAATRARGYAIDDIENEDGVRCVAAPVRDHAGDVVASLSVAAPAYRFEPGDVPAVARRVMAAAAEVSARLGHGRRRVEREGS